MRKLHPSGPRGLIAAASPHSSCPSACPSSLSHIFPSFCCIRSHRVALPSYLQTSRDAAQAPYKIDSTRQEPRSSNETLSSFCSLAHATVLLQPALALPRRPRQETLRLLLEQTRPGLILGQAQKPSSPIPLARRPPRAQTKAGFVLQPRTIQFATRRPRTQGLQVRWRR